MNKREPDRRCRISAGLLLLLGLLLGAGSACAQPAGAPTIPLNDLQPGMKGEVWTVFKGREPEPFAVQVTGILRNALGPGKSMILCELTDLLCQLVFTLVVEILDHRVENLAEGHLLVELVGAVVEHNFHLLDLDRNAVAARELTGGCEQA